MAVTVQYYYSSSTQVLYYSATLGYTHHFQWFILVLLSVLKHLPGSISRELFNLQFSRLLAYK